MVRRQILSQSERESLLALPDDELTLTRMAYFSEHDLARFCTGICNMYRVRHSVSPSSSEENK